MQPGDVAAHDGLWEMCDKTGHDIAAHYEALTACYKSPRLRPPLNRVARLKAGFTASEIELLEASGCSESPLIKARQNERGSPSKCSATYE